MSTGAEPSDEAAASSSSWWDRWRDLAGRLEAAGVANAAKEASWLVEEASGLRGPATEHAWSEQGTPARLAELDSMAARRLAGEPIQYVLGHWPFRSLELTLDRRVLIPRPETEVVCQYALDEIDRLAVHARRGGGDVRVVDLGTGSGALALAIAAERAGTAVWATERSSGAAEVARANLAALDRPAHRVQLLEGSWFEPLPADLSGSIDVVVSNPPYVAATDEVDASVLRWEPAEALYPTVGAGGLEAIEVIVGESLDWLATHGSLVLEIGASQGAAARRLALAAGFVEVSIEPDLAGRPRVLVARRIPI